MMILDRCDDSDRETPGHTVRNSNEATMLRHKQAFLSGTTGSIFEVLFCNGDAMMSIVYRWRGCNNSTNKYEFDSYYDFDSAAHSIQVYQALMWHEGIAGIQTVRVSISTTYIVNQLWSHKGPFRREEIPTDLTGKFVWLFSAKVSENPILFSFAS